MTKSHKPLSHLALLVVAFSFSVLGIHTTASAQERHESSAPLQAFIQGGLGNQDTDAYLVGAGRLLPWHKNLSLGLLTLYAEAAIGRWHSNGPKGSSTAWPTQLGVTPVLRLYPASYPKWFGEIGVGGNYIVPLFQSGEKRFSTEFNFGDHAAIGRSFGAWDVAVRVEHFSNAGIAHPTPGENFLQVRAAHRL